MERISQRKLWLFLILGSGLASVWISKNWLFLDASCPHLQDLLLYICAGIGTFIGLLYVIVTRNDSPVSQVVSVITLLVGVLVITSVVGGILGNQPQVQAVYCNPDACQKASLAKALRGTGKLDGAEDVARTCIEDVSKALLPQACSDECSEELSAVLYQKAGRNIDALPMLSITDKKVACESTDLQLQEALVLANEDTLFYAISERQKRLSEKCSAELIQASPVPTPTIQVEVIRQQISVTRTMSACWNKINLCLVYRLTIFP